MCDIVEEYANMKAEEAAKEAAKEVKINTIGKMLERGYSIDEILEIYSDMDKSEIKALEAVL